MANILNLTNWKCYGTKSVNILENISCKELKHILYVFGQLQLSTILEVQFCNQFGNYSLQPFWKYYYIFRLEF